MLRVILSKLTSKRGASLSMALMLLLVCTTVAGVALTAATVVAGRQARTKDVDKSYYNVTSAAKLFWDEMRDSHVVVSATRSCATSNGTSQSIDPNSWTCTIDGVDAATVPLSPANASLFQLATCDLLFGTGTGSGGKHTFEAGRKLDATKIAATVDTSGTVPTLNEVSPPDTTYAAFTITPSDDIKERFKTVYVTVSRKYGDTFEFVFSEKDPSNSDSKANYECTIIAGVSLSGGTFTREEGNSKFSSTLDVSWTPLTMSSGGAEE